MVIEMDKPIAGKREERRLERRQTILAVAKQSFLENGYAGTTMSAISAKLGGSKGTLWNHFASKEELFAAFLDEVTLVFRNELMSVLEPTRELRPALETFARRFIEKISMPESIQMYRLVVGESGRSPEVGRMFYERAPGVVEAFLTRFLADHAQAGHLQTDDPARAARLLMTLCTGGDHQRMLCGGPEVDRSELPKEAVRIVDQFLRVCASQPRGDDPMADGTS